jgi:hypothetical protein
MIEKRITVLGELDTAVEVAAEREFPHFEFLIYNYESGYYSGSGTMLLKTVEGKYYTKDLGHCSCYGPDDGMGDGELYNSIEEIKASEGWFEQFKTVISEFKK